MSESDKVKWTDYEIEWLEAAYVAPDIRAIVTRKEAGYMRAVGNLMADKYKEQLGEPFREETPQQFAQRIAKFSRRVAKGKTREVAETTEHWERRLQGVGERIYNWLKRTSPNNSRNKTGAALAPLPSKPPARRPRKKSGYALFGASDHPERPKPSGRRRDIGEYTTALKVAWDKLPPEDRAHFNEEAAKMNQAAANDSDFVPESEDGAHGAGPEGTGGGDESQLADAEAETRAQAHARAEQQRASEEFLRGCRATALPDIISATVKHWQNQTGWVGMYLVGGFDAGGEIAAHVECTGEDSAGRTLYQRLGDELGIQPEQLKAILFDFLREVYLPPSGPRTAVQLSDCQLVELSKQVVALQEQASGDDGWPGLVLPSAAQGEKRTAEGTSGNSTKGRGSTAGERDEVELDVDTEAPPSLLRRPSCPPLLQEEVPASSPASTPRESPAWSRPSSPPPTPSSRRPSPEPAKTGPTPIARAGADDPYDGGGKARRRGRGRSATRGGRQRLPKTNRTDAQVRGGGRGGRAARGRGGAAADRTHPGSSDASRLSVLRPPPVDTQSRAPAHASLEQKENEPGRPDQAGGGRVGRDRKPSARTQGIDPLRQFFSEAAEKDAAVKDAKDQAKRDAKKRKNTEALGDANKRHKGSK
ncbi:hypothetical protein BV25DRAFT_1914856 [Artomyces pyxidatus]|uniref:Uncharacterized protein n=1 Tax=Artomyces pyxidatus TaxID=48021 RepID=A0ACB8T5L3_9AGAM|nr:hypothetical protein BV25DRAFT_1914856 [Artomyces pyxidatus]